MRTAPRLLRTMIFGALGVALLAPASAAYASPSAGSLQQQINAKYNALEKVIEQYNAITIQLQQSKDQQAKLQATLQLQQAAVDSASAGVSQMAAAAYKRGPMSSLNALLRAGTPSALVDQLTVLNEAARMRNTDVDKYRQIRDKFQADKSKLDQNVAAQQAQQAQLASQRSQINTDIAKLNQMKAQAGIKDSTPAATPKNIPYYPGKAGIAVRFAYKQLGKPYHYASAGPNEYDCSGLTMAAWAAAGVSLPHNAAMQYHSITHISRSQLKPGDLVLYNGLGHVAIYIGNNQIIHSPHTGDVVRIASINIDSIYGYGRP